MLCYGAKDLARAFRTVRKNTLQIAEEIPEDKYTHAAASGTRTVAQLLTHIALTSRFPLAVHREKRTTLEGFDFPGLVGRIAAEEQKVSGKRDIIALLKREGEDFAAWLEGLSDDFLCERVTQAPGMDPASKTRFEMIMGTKEHEMHHRGQLMLIERQLGIVPHLTRQMQERVAARSAS